MQWQAWETYADNIGDVHENRTFTFSEHSMDNGRARMLDKIKAYVAEAKAVLAFVGVVAAEAAASGLLHGTAQTVAQILIVIGGGAAVGVANKSDKAVAAAKQK